MAKKNLIYYAVQYYETETGQWKFYEGKKGPRLYKTKNGAKIASGHCDIAHYIETRRGYTGNIPSERKVVKLKIEVEDIQEEK